MTFGGLKIDATPARLIHKGPFSSLLPLNCVNQGVAVFLDCLWVQEIALPLNKQYFWPSI